MHADRSCPDRRPVGRHRPSEITIVAHPTKPHGRSVCLWIFRCGCPIFLPAPGADSADSSQITIRSLDYGTIQSNTPATAVSESSGGDN